MTFSNYTASDTNYGKKEEKGFTHQTHLLELRHPPYMDLPAVHNTIDKAAQNITYSNILHRVVVVDSNMNTLINFALQ